MSVAARGHRFTVFDMMEAKGMFSANPLNADSPEFSGPAEYPKMLYHPEGKERVIQPAEIVVTPFGPEKHNELKEVINQVVHNAAEEKALRAEGWHLHLADSMEAAGKPRPPTSSAERISDLQAQIKKLEVELEAANRVKATAAPAEQKS